MALNLLPKGTGRRRAIEKVAELRRDLSLALSQMHAAGDEIALLQQDLAEARGMQAEAEEIVVQQQATVDELTTERDYWRDEALALKARFGPHLAAEANANRIDVPPMIRPIDGPEDQATGPIDVRPLWDAHGIQPVTDPGQVS
ncbi:hypothetical protein ACIP6X_02170 [Streptomyces coeruleorubidus]|uniref:hypothetical protein n=1 Tax=Streptomyces coeruleorubidus TaxID=116188 RepID=UPI0038050D1B